MLVINYEITKWLTPVDLSLDSKSIDRINIIGSPSVEDIHQNFSCLDVQSLLWGRLVLTSNGKQKHTFENVTLLEFFDQILGATHELFATGENTICFFPHENYHLDFLIEKKTNSVSISLHETDVKRLWKVDNIDIIAFYRLLWASNIAILEKLLEYQPEVFQYFRFTMVHPGARKFVDYNLRQQW